uniref:Uncharacterized protein n=1 Tax=Acrobeloides nanus TaxID=290746 RepID=A0A914CXK6_9BILA
MEDLDSYDLEMLFHSLDIDMESQPQDDTVSTTSPTVGSGYESPGTFNPIVGAERASADTVGSDMNSSMLSSPPWSLIGKSY